jgi:hypothetical protein
MTNRTENGEFSAWASLGSYIVLGVIWFVLGIFYGWLEFTKPASSAWKGSLLCFAAGALWIVWLRGFRLTIQGDQLAYRDGLYRSKSGRISQVIAFEDTWVDTKDVPRALGIPRFLIKFEGGGQIMINIKPFSRSALAEFRRRVEPCQKSPRLPVGP